MPETAETSQAESSGLGSEIYSEKGRTLWSRLFNARKDKGHWKGRNRVLDVEPSRQEALVWSWAEEGTSKKS